MDIQPDPTFQKYLVDWIEKREFKGERTGVHCSDLIYCINKQALRKLKPLPPTEQDILIFSLGWYTQWMLTGKDEDVATITVDGIQVTPDEMYKGIPWELKASYQSASRPIEENISWIRQIMAQCYVTKTVEARLSRFEIMGDWKWVFGKKDEKKDAKRPTLSAWRLKFTQKELNKNWAWMKERRDIFLNILESKVLVLKAIAIPSGNAYECKYCDYFDCMPDEEAE